MSDLRAVIEAFQTRLWGKGDPSVIDELMSDDVEVFGIEAEPMHGGAAYAALHRMLAAQFADITVVILHTVEDGEWIAGESMFAARHRARGGEIAARSMFMARIVHGKIVSMRSILDLLSAFEQAGLLPPLTLESLLLGRRPKL